MEDLLREHGGLLYDYCLTELSPADAELAACGALVSAVHHADRPREDDQPRAWLYALARAHRSARARVNPASVGSWTRPGSTADPLLAEALTALPSPHREVLDLAVRHHLTHPEIALIFDVGAVEIEHLATDAADRLQIWVAAVTSARDGGCSELSRQVSDAPASPARRRRAQISRHISQCPACQNAPRATTAGEHLDHLPTAAAPATMTARLTHVDPLNPQEGWRADGFPPQTHTLAEALADLPSAALTSSSPLVAEEEFRAWEQHSRATEDFWARRDDESDPEARLSLRPFLPAVRVSALIAAAVACVLAAGAGWSALQPEPHQTVVPVAAPATITLLASDPPPGALLDEPPPSLPSATPRTRSPSPSRSPTPTRSPAKAASHVDPSTSRSRLRDIGGLQEPPRWPTRKPSASSTRRALPGPAPPTARLSPSSLVLGTDRSDSVTLLCTGSCRIISGWGTDGITVNGNRITVTAPAAQPGCEDTTESGIATLTWSGAATGDGRTSEGATRGGGTLTLPVSWTVEADKGTWIPTELVTHAGDREGRWSNCPQG